MKKRRRTLLDLGIVVVVYVCSYGILSFLGGYRLVASGHYRPITWMAMEDVFVWQPRFGMCYPFDTIGGDHVHHLDEIGTLFYPLIQFDQCYIHRSQPFITVSSDGHVSDAVWPPIELMHPVARRTIRIADAIKAKYAHELASAEACGDRHGISRIVSAIFDELEQQTKE